MSFRYFAKISVLLGCSLIFAPVQAFAQKAPGVQFHPASGWAFSEIGQTCSLETEFNNGFIIRILSDGQGLNAMAINVRQPVFKEGQAYSARVTVPGMVNKSLPGVAGGEEILNINLRGQADFFESMRNSGIFDLHIDQNAFRFYMVGLSENARKFESCLRKSAPAEGTRVAAASGQESVPMTEITSENPEISIQQLPVTKTRKLGGTVIERIEAPAIPPEALLAEPTELRIPPAVAAAGSGLSEQDMARGKTVPADTGKTAMDMEEKMMTERIVEPLPMPDPKIERVGAAPTDDIFEAESVDDLRVTSSGYVMSEDEFAPGSDIKVNRQTYLAEADFSEAGREESASGRRKADPNMLRKISELESMVQNLKEENVALNMELKMSLKESRNEEVSISSNNWNLERATMRYQEAERQMKRLGQQLSKEKAQCDLEKRELEAMLFDPQVTNQQQLARLAELEDQLLAAEEELENQRMRYEERLRMLQEQNASL